MEIKRQVRRVKRSRLNELGLTGFWFALSAEVENVKYDLGIEPVSSLDANKMMRLKDIIDSRLKDRLNNRIN